MNNCDCSSRTRRTVYDALYNTPARRITRSSAISRAIPAQIAVGIADVNTTKFSFFRAPRNASRGAATRSRKSSHVSPCDEYRPPIHARTTLVSHGIHRRWIAALGEPALALIFLVRESNSRQNPASARDN